MTSKCYINFTKVSFFPGVSSDLTRVTSINIQEIADCHRLAV